jgi:Transglutaminase-like superfamily
MRQLTALQCRKYLAISLAILAAAVLSIAPYLTSSTELVRMRNALVLMDETGHPLDWTPDSIPPDFKLERGPVDPVFAEASRQLGLDRMPSDWEKVLAISRHLLGHPSLIGPPIQSNLRDTYRRIISDGDGYCGDFTRVFMAFAISAGIPVRAWAFSLDGFGGHGHIWPEIWNRQLGKWQLVDIYNNFYFHNGDRVAVSAAVFRHAIKSQPLPLHRALLHAQARPGYESEEKMWTWYRKGLPGWYMVWGNNVFSRSLESLEGIALNVFPGVVLLKDDTNEVAIDAMWRLKSHLLVVLSIGVTWIIINILGIYFLSRLKRLARSE